MLRRIVGLGRRPDEDYIDWLQRATHKAEQLASDAGLVNWVHSHLLSKWHWAGHVARRLADTWISRTASWRDSDWQSSVAESGMATRKGHPDEDGPNGKTICVATAIKQD